jgi:hypothetical protein
MGVGLRLRTVLSLGLVLGLWGCPPSDPDRAASPPDPPATAGTTTSTLPAGPDTGLDKPSTGAEVPFAEGGVSAEDRRCESASDCTTVTLGCCACSSGGQPEAVRRDRAEALEAASEARCADKDVFCPMSHNCVPDDRVQCLEGVCSIRPAGEPQPR